jgi:hypothetical protein
VVGIDPLGSRTSPRQARRPAGIGMPCAAARAVATLEVTDLTVPDRLPVLT